MTPADIGALLARYGVHALRVRLVARLDCEVYRITPQPRSGGDLNAPAPVVDRDGQWLRRGMAPPMPHHATSSC